MDKFEPDWNEAPEWANYWAVDSCGEAYWFETKPHKHYGDWVTLVSEMDFDQFFDNYSTQGDWTKSLFSRPNTLFEDLKESLEEALEIKEGTREPSRVTTVDPQPSAASILKAGLGHMEDRAKTYDAEGGERSMAKTVEAFNALTGRDLTETEGWLMMVCLKLARANQGGFRMDSFEDGAAYMALMGECAAYMESKES